MLSSDRCTLLFFNDTATTEIYTLSLHDALPISLSCVGAGRRVLFNPRRRSSTSSGMFNGATRVVAKLVMPPRRSEEHTSELQSRQYLVCRLLLAQNTTSNEITMLLVRPSVKTPR